MREEFCPKTCGFCIENIKKARHLKNTCSQPATIDVALLARNISNFGWQLLERVTLTEAENENIVLSPISIAFTLEMILNGLAQHQPRSRLKFLALSGHNIGSYNRLLTQLTKRKQKLQLSITNSLFLHNDVVPKMEYMTMIANCLSAHLELKDFRENPLKAAREINLWIAQETNGLIHRLVEESTFPSSTVLLLANVLYFNGKWKTPFVRENGAETMMIPFMSVDGRLNRVPTMVMQSEFLFAEDENTILVGLPYKNDEAVLYIILPKSGLISEWRSSELSELGKLISAAKPEEIKLAIPKFNIKRGTALKGVLSDMGLGELFDPRLANFSGMVEPNTASPLYVSEAIHSAAIRVHEKGTEAAAATGLGASFFTLPPQRRFVAVDRPFMFLLRHEATHANLFIGQVVQLH
uniref:Serpin domain-containing protein n=1 Tax=Plectus sambesii TaxID=2011161 RepID=A0A914W7A5_9BILA